MATAELTDVEDAPPPPEEPEGLYEIVDGKVEEKIVGFLEGRIAFRLAHLLEAFAEARQLGWAFVENLFRTDKSSVRDRRPDVAFISAQSWPVDRPFPEGNALDSPPDLAVEVISPTDRADKLQIKIREYFRAGVKQVWVVYRTSATVVVHESAATSRTLTRADVLDGGTIIPGFRLAVAELLPEPASPPGAVEGGEVVSR